MNFVKFVLESRGPVNLTKRTFQILTRFGVRPGKMGNRFDRFMDLMDEYGCRPSFPITALPMSRNPAFAHRLIERGAELAVHAYSHIDLTTLDYEQQSEHMGKAVQLFREKGVAFTGFRAPYLHWNEDTMRVVEDYKFRYSSNEIVMWDALGREDLTPEQRDGLEKSRAFYKPHDAETRFVLPSRHRGFIEIPVSLPDDETLLDRMYVHDVEMLGRVWRYVLDATYERGELFTVQLHPERIDFFTGALGCLLKECRSRNPGVWIATLDEIAQWWMDKSKNSVAFVKDHGAYHATVKAAAGSSLVLREGGRERLLEPRDVRIESDVRPAVGISAGSDRRAVQWLQDLGYIVEVGEPSEGFVIHLGTLESAEYADMQPHLRELAACDGPMLRFGRWPHGNRSALAVTGDIDALTLGDFVQRFLGR